MSEKGKKREISSFSLSSGIAHTQFHEKMSGKNEAHPKQRSNHRDENDPANSTQCETDLEIEKRLANIFNRLDRNGNGRIDIQDLISALKGVGMSQQYAEVSKHRLKVNTNEQFPFSAQF